MLCSELKPCIAHSYSAWVLKWQPFWVNSVLDLGSLELVLEFKAVGHLGECTSELANRTVLLSRSHERIAQPVCLILRAERPDA
jgi:hypothetical protein